MHRIERSDDPGLGSVLKEQINRFNLATTAVSSWHPISYAVHDDDGDLIAGVDGWEWGGTCYLDAVWVREDHRGQGIGSALMAAAEREARRLGCHQIALETHSFQAPAFYRRLGFVLAGEVDGYPRGHSFGLYVKPLAAGSHGPP